MFSLKMKKIRTIDFYLGDTLAVCELVNLHMFVTQLKTGNLFSFEQAEVLLDDFLEVCSWA